MKKVLNLLLLALASFASPPPSRAAEQAFLATSALLYASGSSNPASGPTTYELACLSDDVYQNVEKGDDLRRADHEFTYDLE